MLANQILDDDLNILKNGIKLSFTTIHNLILLSHTRLG